MERLIQAIKKKIKDHKQDLSQNLLNKFFEQSQKKWKEMQLFKNLKKEVETGANGTQSYVIKKGINKNKIATKDINGS